MSNWPTPSWIAGETRRVDMRSFRDDSEQLERFRRRDFGAMRAELRSFLPESDDVRIFPLPLVHRITRDLARHYVRRPTRTWSRAGVTMDAWTRELRLDRLMLGLHQRLVAHQSQIVTILPGVGGPSVKAWSPYEVTVTLEDPLDGELAYARQLNIRVPLASEDGEAVMGRWVLTASEAYEEWPDGTRRGLWHADRSDLSHPLGRIPAVGTRVNAGMDGQWFPAIAEDMLAVQIGLVLALTDILHVASVQSVGQPVLVGPGAGQVARDLDLSSRKMWVLDSHRGGADRGDLSFEIITGDPPLEKYLAAIERTLTYFASYNYLDLGTIGLPSIVTGAAVREIRQYQTDELERWSLQLEDLEIDVARLLLDVDAASPYRVAARPRGELLSVEYHYPEPSRTLQDVQTVEAAAKLGLDSVREAVARHDGVTLEDAGMRVADRLKRWRDMIGEAPVGN